MRWVYGFGGGEADGGRQQRDLLGSKGAQLAEMCRIGLNVPPGLTITTEACRHFLREGDVPDGLWDEVDEAIDRVETRTGLVFGASDVEPLLLSARSGAAMSIPGMMDTILNLGANESSVAALAAASGDDRFAWECYRRFVQMYGGVVARVDADFFEESLSAHREAEGVADDAELPLAVLRSMVLSFKGRVEERLGAPFPDDPVAQVHEAVRAVFRSWDDRRARDYRRVSGISDELGTAVILMAMVYGNRGPDSGSGVAFTRDPVSGESKLYGEFLMHAQGEDVVAGIRDPRPIDALEQRFPQLMSELEQVRVVLEAHYRDMQDLEFTIDRGELYILQTRTGKRTGRAAMRIAVAMVDEGLIDVPTAILRVEPSAVEELLHPAVDASGDAEELVRGLPASPGAGVGRLVFSAAAARAWASRGERVVLVTDETSADDFDGMEAAEGVLTARGGMTSHAAVVARGMGKCCVVGAGALHVDEEATRLKVGDVTLEEGEWVTLDGTTGRVFRGRLPTVDVGLDDAFWRLMDWADEARRLGVRANADTPEDAAHARELGAEGIGLCRTEYMFFGAARLAAMRTMILAPDESERREALELLLPMQRADFEGLFRAMAGYPVTIRLLDPPFHELLPDEAEEIAELAAASRHSLEEMEEGVAHHREDNPMLGHRGVRLAITYPEVTEMQARAVFEAALAVYAEGVDVRPEIMVPLVAVPGELTEQIAIIDRVAAGLFKEAGHTIPYLIGTMIELPRAALVAEELARHADFFSFGTNDLTQTTLGMSRDDSGTFLPTYLERGILRADPFRTLDQEGVGRLVRLAVTEGRSAQPGLTMGICGEHGADPSSVEFFHRAGLDYVSCSPFRVPVARISAAQAALRASMVERRARTRRPYA